MNQIALPPPGGITEGDIGALLARTRRSRRFSQMDLALEAGISPRHLSFVETGRARPSRALVLRLCEALEVPPRDTDAFLLAAGFAPAHRETPLESPAMTEVLAALRLMLERHTPLPSVALDGHWDIVMVNAAYGAMMDAMLAEGADPAAGQGPTPALELLPAPRPNMLRLLCHPQGARKHVLNWAEVTRAVLQRAQHDARGAHHPGAREILDEVMAMPGIKRLMAEEQRGPAPLVVPVELPGPEGTRLRLLSTISTLGTAQDLTLRELHIESFHPAP